MSRRTLGCVCGGPGPARSRGRSRDLLSRGVIAGGGMFLALKSGVSKGSAYCRNRKKGSKQYGTTWLLLAAECCRLLPGEDAQRRASVCVFVWVQDARPAGPAQIQQMCSGKRPTELRHHASLDVSGRSLPPVTRAAPGRRCRVKPKSELKSPH